MMMKDYLFDDTISCLFKFQQRPRAIRVDCGCGRRGRGVRRRFFNLLISAAFERWFGQSLPFFHRYESSVDERHVLEANHLVYATTIKEKG